MESKRYRLKEFIDPKDGRSLVVDTSAGLSFGALPGLERFSEAIAPILPYADGIVTSPGQARRISNRTRQEAALIVRANWTNALRGQDFVLPPESTEYLPLISSQEGLDLGASALVIDFLLGFTEEIDAQCVELTVQMGLAGTSLGMPLIVDVQPVGPRVVLRSKAIELGVSYALEGGADGVVIPWPGSESFANIHTMAMGAPLWVRPDSLEPQDKQLNQALESGASGLWLDERLFTAAEPVKLVGALRVRTHTRAAETMQEA